jgi:TIGR03009 family protein
VKSVCSQIETFTTFRAYPLRATGRGTVCVRIMDDTLLPFRMNIPIMRDSLRSLAAPLALVLVTGTCFDVMAQPARPTRPSGAQQTTPLPRQPQQPNNMRPPGNPARVEPEQITPRVAPPAIAAPQEPISPELEELLKEWEDKSSLIKVLKGEHQRTVYNLVFEVEQRANGVFYLETPDKGRIELVGVKPGKTEKSKRTNPKTGSLFRLEEGRGEKWICSGQEIIAINDEEKTYEIMPLPKNIQGENIIKSPLPFLFGMKAEEAKQRYLMTLKSNTKEQAVIGIIPRLDSDRQNYTEAIVILEKAHYLPTAVKLYDPSGNLETVYRFDNVKINQRGVLPTIFTGDPWHPKLTGLKRFIPPETADEPVKNEPRFNQAAPRAVVPAGNQSVPRTGQGSARTNNK